MPLYGRKEKIGRNVLHYYPKLSGRIIIHKDARKMQIGRVISGKCSPLPFSHTSKPPIYKFYKYSKKTFLL